MNERNLSDLAGAWLMREAELRILAGGHVASLTTTARGLAPSGRGAMAVVPVYGVLSKSPAWWSSGMSYGDIRQRVRTAAADSGVSSILLHIDSPGGNSAGVDETAADIAAAARIKPVWAYIEDLGASGAYYLASQATQIFANRSAIVGSIGVYTVLVDSSKLAEKAGLQLHVVKAGDFKAGVIPGVPISAGALAERQAIVNSIYDRFVGVVASGRKMSREQAATLADGRVYPASEGVKIGLLDGIATLDGVINQLLNGPPPATGKVKGQTMDAIAQWESAVKEKLKSNPRMSKADATRAVVQEQPELHQAYLAAYNEKWGPRVRGR